MATLLDNDQPVNPVSQGKLKALWDAIRQVPDPSAPGYMPPPGPPPPVTPPGQPNLSAAVSAAPSPGDSARQTPLPPPPPPSAGPVAPPPSGPGPADPASSEPFVMPDASRQMQGAVPDVSQPDPKVRMADPKMADMPASGSVTDLEARVNRKPSLIHQLGQVGINLGLAGAAAASGAPSGERGVAAGLDVQREQGNIERKSLVDQLEAARREREKEFDTAQRTTEAANAAAEANRTRDTISRTLAGSRENVATTNAAARTGVAATNAEAHKSAAETAADAAIQRATIGANASIERGKYAADAAANRQTRSIEAADRRQQSGFTHTDTKPTADEDRRADLSEAMKGYSVALKEIAQRRPELFGKIQGRMTEARARVGSDDPDIMAIGRLQDAIGTTIMGAHALRNANHIAVAGGHVSDIHNSADAVVKNIDAAMKGMDQFQTIQRPTLAGRVAPSAPAKSAATSKSAPAKANDPLGIR